MWRNRCREIWMSSQVSFKASHHLVMGPLLVWSEAFAPLLLVGSRLLLGYCKTPWINGISTSGRIDWVPITPCLVEVFVSFLVRIVENKTVLREKKLARILIEVKTLSLGHWAIKEDIWKMLDALHGNHFKSHHPDGLPLGHF